MEGGGGGGGGGGGKQKKKSYDDGDVEHGVGHVGGAGDHEGHDELADGGAEGVGEAREGGGADAAAVREPHVGVAGRGVEHEGLGQADEDLAEHGDAEQAAVARVRPGVAHPVAHEDQGRRRHDRRLRPQVQRVDGHGRHRDEGEQERRREPVDVALGPSVVRGRLLRDGSEGYPL